MTISFRCTSCGRTLKVAHDLAGRKGKCPHCKASLFVPEGPEAAVAEGPPRKRAAAARPPAREPEDREDVGEEATPARGRKGRKAQKGKKSLLVPLLIAGGLALLLPLCGGAAAVGVWWFLPGGPPDDNYFLPDNTQMMGVVHLDELLNSGAVQLARKELPDFDKQLAQVSQTGLDPANFDRVFFGAQPATTAGNANTPPNFILVLYVKQPIKAADFQASLTKNDSTLSFTEKKIGRFTAYEGQRSKPPASGAAPAPTFLMPDDKRVVIGPAPVVQAVLERDKKLDLPDKLQAAWKQTDAAATVAYAANVKEAFPRPAAPAPNRPGEPPAAANNLFDKVDGLGVTARVGTDVDLTVTGLCQDAAAANDLNATITKQLAQFKNPLVAVVLPAEIKDLLDIQPVVNGANITVIKTVKVAPLIALAKKPQKAPVGFPFPFK